MAKFGELTEQEARELQMDTLREESYKWPEEQRRAVVKELEKHGLPDYEAWEQMEKLNRQFPDYSLEEMLTELNRDPEEQEYQNRVEEWFDQAPEGKARKKVLEMLYEKSAKEIWRWIENNTPKETWETI